MSTSRTSKGHFKQEGPPAGEVRGKCVGLLPKHAQRGGLCRERGLWRPQQAPAVGNRAFGRHATESACSAHGRGRPRQVPRSPWGRGQERSPRRGPSGPALQRGCRPLSGAACFSAAPRGPGPPWPRAPLPPRPRSRRGRHSPACPRCAACPFPPGRDTLPSETPWGQRLLPRGLSRAASRPGQNHLETDSRF